MDNEMEKIKPNNMKKRDTTLTPQKIYKGCEKMFGINNKVWALMSKEKQELAIERFLNRYYRERNDCYIEKGIND